MEVNRKAVLETYAIEKQKLAGRHEYNNAEIQTAIESLAEELRLPIKMYLDGFDYEYISDELGLDESCVKCRIFFAWQKITSLLTAN